MSNGAGRKVITVIVIIVFALVWLEASREDSVIGNVYWDVVGGILGGMGLNQAITFPILVVLAVIFGYLAIRLLRSRRVS